MSRQKLFSDTHEVATPRQTDNRPRWHRNPRLNRFVLRLPNLGLEKIWLTETFFEYAGTWHMHPQTQVLIVLEGGMRLQLDDDVDWNLRPGEGAVIGAGVRHCTVHIPDTRRMLIISLLVSNEPPNLLHNWITRSTLCWRWTCDPAILAASAEQLNLMAHENGPLNPARVMHAVWGLMVPQGSSMVPRELTSTSVDGADAGVDKRVLFIESLMRNSCSDPFDAERLARSLQLSVSQMNRLFKLHRNSTPLRVLQRIRLEEARQYLVNSSLSAKEIATRCGFVNAAHFSKLFRQAYGMTPRAYRAAAPDGRLKAAPGMEG